MAGSVLVKQGVVEQLAAAVDGAGGGHQCHLTDVACALVGVQQLTQQICALVGAVLHHLAILEGNVEILDELTVKDVGLCAVNDAVHLILMGRGEHLLGGDVGQEGHTLLVFAAGALPHRLFRQTHGQVGAVGAFKMHAFQIQGVHLCTQLVQAVQMLLPLPYRIAAGHTAGIKDQLPLCFNGGGGVQLREHLLCPRLCGQGGDGPLHPVVHGVLPPRLHKAAVRAVHPADLGTVQPGKQFRVVRDEVQHAHTALALGVVQIAAQLPALVVGQGLFAAQLHAGAGDGVVGPVHLHIPRTRLKGAAHAQPCQRGTFQRTVDDQHLARLGVDPHPDDEIGIFLEKFVKVFHS